MSYPPLNTMVIGFGHKARHGKDHAAQYLMRQSHKSAVKVSFSDALYGYCRVAHGMTTKDAPLLQRVGVEMREKDPETWIRAAYYAIADKAPNVAFIPDVRFPNEVDFVKGLGGFVVKVQRFNKDGSPFVAADRDPNHISETALDGFRDWDAIVHNANLYDFEETLEHVYFRLASIWDNRNGR